ncbi:MAG TPA: ABC transporter permease [Bryobacteraceae bacterium]
MQRDENLDEELQAHLEIETRQLMEQRGCSREEAESLARKAFGNRTLVAEVTREMWGFAWLERTWQDLRYALRVLRQSPGFSIAVILSLALGIGASTAVFSIADTVFLRPLPYSDPQQLVWVAVRFPGREFLMSPDYVAWRRDNDVFDQLAATQATGGGSMILNGPDPAELHAARVSFNFLSALRISPLLGHSFTPEEELPNGSKAVLLTNRLWRSHFNARKEIVGQSISLDGQPYTVAGVLPASFVFPMDIKLDILTTLPVSPTASHHDRSMSAWAVFGRLKSGVTLAEARADLNRLFAASKADAPMIFRSNISPVLQPLEEHRVGNARVLLLVLIGAVGCLLLIACANVANLLLARWAARSRELAVKAAIGASRARLVRQLLTETVLLTTLGCFAAMGFVAVALRAFVHYAAGELPRLSEVTLDARVFGVALIVSLLTVLLFGVLPALRAARADIQSVLQKAGRSSISGGYQLLRRSLVAAEIALSLILLSSAALLLQTLWHMEKDHLGFQPEHLLSITVPLQGMNVANGKRQQFSDEIVSYLQSLPGTEAAAAAECTPVSGNSIGVSFSRSDRPLPEPFHWGDSIAGCGIGPDYFKAAATPLVRGRFINEQDFAHPSTVAIINEAAERAYFPGEDPLGKRINGGPQGQWKTVIGVIADTKNQGLNQPAMPEMFINDLALYAGSDLHFIVRNIGDTQPLISGVRAKLQAVAPGAFVKFETVDQTITEMTAGPRFNGILLGSFAAISFLMAVVGVYGVFAFAVTQRTQEIGIRIALGAESRRVLALFMREGILLVGIGSIAGLCGAIALTRYLKTFLYEVSPTDPRTYLAVLTGLGFAAAFATFLPARRAASVDPMLALRHD